MKQVFVLLIAVLLSANAFCQRGTAERYDAKSRHLGTAGLALVVGGGTLSIVGIALIAKENTITNGNHVLTSQATWGVLLITAGVLWPLVAYLFTSFLQ